MENSNTYSYAAEVAVAVGGTILVWFFCNIRKKDAEQRMAVTADDITDAKDDEIEQDNSKMGETTKTDDNEINAGEKQLSSESSQSSDDKENKTTSNEVVDSGGIVSSNENVHEVNKCKIITSDKATQTMDENCGTTQIGGSNSSYPSIVWQAVLVNDAVMQYRYRTELHVDIDGVISHSESIHQETFAGMEGMKQVLVKIQS